MRDWPDQLAHFVPIVVVLRDFARDMRLTTEEVGARHLWEFIERRLADQKLEFADPALHKVLEDGHAARGPAPSRRLYPWNDEPDPDAANYLDTGIGRISPVGCFPRGRSVPYGVLDLTGNVWEWVRSVFMRGELLTPDRLDRYEPGGVAEDLSAADDVDRVLRGGAFFNHARHVRCAMRVGARPGERADFGFRLALSPFVFKR